MKEEMELALIKSYAKKCHEDANCKYDGKPYFIHVEMVAEIVLANKNIFKKFDDFLITYRAAFTHDTIEDAKQTFNNVKDVCGEDVAKITLAVTDVHGENRLMRHLLTMHKTVSDYRAIILKMADIYANATYSANTGSSMYKKYREEYAYRKPIFKKALSWYKEYLDMDEVEKLWEKLDIIHSLQIKNNGKK